MPQQREVAARLGAATQEAARRAAGFVAPA